MKFFVSILCFATAVAASRAHAEVPGSIPHPIWAPAVVYSLDGAVGWTALELAAANHPNVEKTKTSLRVLTEKSEIAIECQKPEDKIANWAKCTVNPYLLFSPLASKALFYGLVAFSQSDTGFRVYAATKTGETAPHSVYANLTEREINSWDDPQHIRCSRYTPFDTKVETFRCYANLIGRVADANVARKWIEGIVSGERRVTPPNRTAFKDSLTATLKEWTVESAELVAFSEDPVGPPLSLRIRFQKKTSAGKTAKFLREYEFGATGQNFDNEQKYHTYYHPRVIRETMPIAW